MSRENTQHDLGLLVLRLVAGTTMAFFGAAKMFGWFGGAGFAGTLAMFHDRMGIPPVFGSLAIFAELLGGLGLVTGLLTRIAAFGVFCTMAVATFTKFQNWGTLVAERTLQGAVGEAAFPALIGAAALALMLCGAGRFSLDQRFWGRKR
jgi:putative oxidoreductase